MFEGRIDQQIKLRGQRIELGEIESVLNRQAGVRESVVVARTLGTGDVRLVAYIVPKIEDRGLKIEDSRSDAPEPLSSILYPLSSELRAFLKEKLPDYMIPSIFVLLDALPLSPNGKLDRRLLPEPEQQRMPSEHALVAPRDPVELRLVQLWEGLLRVSPVGITDNFFELGGHSLLAMHMMSQIRAQFGQEISLATIFQSGTIEKLAQVLRQQIEQPPWSPLVPLRATGSKPPFFCVHPGTGSAYCFMDLVRHLDAEQPFYGLQARGLDGRQPPHTKIEAMAAYYVDAIKTIQPEGPYSIGGHSFGGFAAFVIAQQLRARGDEVGLLAVLDTTPVIFRKTSGRDLIDYEKDEALVMAEVVNVVEQFFGKHLNMTYDELRQLEPELRMNRLLETLQDHQIMPADADLSMLRAFLEVVKANDQSTEDYIPQVYPGRITLFRTGDIPPKLAEELLPTYMDPALGWSELSTEPVDVHFIPGIHITMLTEPHVQALAQHLQTCLDHSSALSAQRLGIGD